MEDIFGTRTITEFRDGDQLFELGEPSRPSTRGGDRSRLDLHIDSDRLAHIDLIADYRTFMTSYFQVLPLANPSPANFLVGVVCVFTEATLSKALHPAPPVLVFAAASAPLPRPAFGKECV
jgi:hypothetical protein